MTAKELLAQARALVENGWTQKSFGRNANGTPGDAWKHGDYEPVQFCMLGAMRSARGMFDEERKVENIAYHKGCDALSSTIAGKGYTPDSDLYHYNIVGYNDEPGRTKEEVLEVFDLAIAKFDQ